MAELVCVNAELVLVEMGFGISDDVRTLKSELFTVCFIPHLIPLLKSHSNQFKLLQK